MAYGHVGRPTNEEMAAKRRKKLLKILLPSSLVAIVAIMIIGNNGFKGLMGNSVCEYTCESGWTRDGSMCYQETASESQTNTYLLGDANYDDRATLEDYSIIKNAIESGAELNNIEKVVYDLNQDGLVDDQDISGYSTSTNGEYTLNSVYMCPGEKVENTELDGEKITTTTIYEKTTQNVCTAKITVRKEKSAFCNIKPEQENKTVIEDNDGSPTSEGDVICEPDYNKKIIVCKQKKQVIINNEEESVDETEEEYDIVDMNDDESNEEIEIDDVDVEESVNDDVSVIYQNSNLLKYSDNNQLDHYGFIKIITKHQNSNVGAHVQANYALYKDESSCKNDTSTVSGGNAGEFPIIVGDEVSGGILYIISVGNKVRKDYAEPISYTVRYNYASRISGSDIRTLWIRQIPISDYYSIDASNNCKKVELQNNSKIGTEDVTFSVTPKKTYNLKISYGILNKESATINKLTFGEKAVLSIADVKKITGDMYSFAGWKISSSDGTTKLLKPDKTNNYVDLQPYIKKSKTYTATANWKAKKYTVQLKNSKTNQIYKQSASFKLYSDLASCNAGNKQNELKLNIKTKYNKSNGKVVIDTSNLGNGKYYLLVKTSSHYNNKCVSISALNKNAKTVKVSPKKFTIKYSGNKNTNNVTMSSQFKYNDKPLKLNNNKFKRTNYKFNGWAVKRVKNKKTQYRCYTSAAKKKAKIVSWTDKSKCKYYVKYKNQQTIKLNSTLNITLVAQWKK